MGDKICYIVGAGENYGLDFEIKPGDYVIAADGGLHHLAGQGIAPDLVIGDFDSAKEKPAGGHVITLDTHKDFTDTFEAIKAGINLGYNVFYIYCGTGGRFDHTYGNIQALAYLSQQGKRGFLVDREWVTTAVTNGGIAFDVNCRGHLSVLAYSDKAAGVCLQGLKYTTPPTFEMCNALPVGVSNEFIGENSSVAVADGTLVVIFPRSALSLVNI
ncbi:MAG: thiamine diphosphokinase [Defluviitaleaceae bacterium]|nr:thiamine diphosphokinase [Defluviitaleaceae bacterium]